MDKTNIKALVQTITRSLNSINKKRLLCIKVILSTPEDIPARIVSPVTPEGQATSEIQSTSVQVSATSVSSLTPEAQTSLVILSKNKGKYKQWRLFCKLVNRLVK